MTKFIAEFLTETNGDLSWNTMEITSDNADEAEESLAKKYNIQPDSLTMWIAE